MTGEVVSLRTEPNRRKRVGSGRGGPGLEARVTALEGNVADIRSIASAAHEAAKTAADNTAQLLSIATAAKGFVGFVKKYGPKTLTFGAGIMTAAGAGNPAIWRFIGSFFGGS